MYFSSSSSPRTCYYALCLISKTMAGANVLFESHWITVQHSAEEKWPLILDGKQVIEDAVPASPDSNAVRFFPPLFGSFDINSLPRWSGLPKASSYQALTASYVTHTGSSLSLSSNSSLSLRRTNEVNPKRTPPRSLSRKPGKKLFASLKDKGRQSPSLSQLRVKSSADMTRAPSHTLSHHQAIGHSKQFSVSTGELLSPDLQKPR